MQLLDLIPDGDVSPPAAQFRSLVDALPALVGTALADGSGVNFVNRQFLDDTGLDITRVLEAGDGRMRFIQRIQPANVLTFEVNLPIGRYQDPLSRASFHRDFQARLEALPAVRAAAAVSRLPVTGAYHTWLTRRLDLPPGSRDASPDQRVIEGHYFEALRIPLLRGRTFTDQDDEKAPRRVVISQAAARVLFGDEEPIGKHLRATGDAPDVEIIGIVAVVAISPRGAVNPMVYHSHRQFAGNRNWGLSQVVAFDHPMPPRPIERSIRS